MTRTMSGMTRLALAAAAMGCAWAGAALAGDCEYSIGSYLNGFIPDFDQKRANGPLTYDGENYFFDPAGLPNNGAMYCVPTSHLNTMAYLANHGFPALMPGLGTSPAWGAPSEYDGATESLRDFGDIMSTSATGGTSDDNGQNGTIEWLEDHAPGKFIVSSSYASQFYAPNLGELGLAALLGAFVHPSIGWYEYTGPSQWKLSGGHRVTMVGAKGWCGGVSSWNRRIRFRDPGSGGSSQTTQSAFSTGDYQATPYDGYFGSENDNGFTVYFSRTQEQISTYGTSDGRQGFLRGYRAIWPKFGVTLQPLGQPGLNFQYPIQPTDHPDPPPNANVPLSAGASAADVAIDPALIHVYYVVKGTSQQPDPRVFRLDRRTGVSEVFYTGTQARRVETGRHKEVFILDGQSLVKIDPTAPVIRAAGIPTPHPVDAIAYDDRTDRLVGLAGQSGKIILWVRDVTAAPQVLDLPPSVVFDGERFLSISPADGSIWVRSLNSPNVYRLAINAGGGLTVADTVSSSLFVGAAGLDVDATQTREHILLARQGAVIVFERTPGGWQRNTTSDFAGLPANGMIKLARSRTNYDPESMAGPDQHDEPPDVDTAELLDCPGDLNGDGIVNAHDLAGLLGLWGGDAMDGPADINRDGEVNAHDLANLLGGWGPCDEQAPV